MKKDTCIAIPRGSKEAEELMQSLKKSGQAVYDVEKELSVAIDKMVSFRKQPLLTIALGASILDKKQFKQISAVIKADTFDSLDVLLQVGAGDLDLAFDLMTLVRSKVSGKLTVIIPRTVSGPGSIIALLADEIVGIGSTGIMPLNIPSMSPGMLGWYLNSGEMHPLYSKNAREFSRVYQISEKQRRELLAKGYTKELLDHMMFQQNRVARDFLIPSLARRGMKARVASGKESRLIEKLAEPLNYSMDDFVHLTR